MSIVERSCPTARATAPTAEPSRALPRHIISRLSPQYSTGGLVAWGIITLLLCTIPGVVALVKVANINNARTVEEQQRAVSDVKTWCTVGTVLGVLFYIIGILGGVAAAL